MAGSHTIPVYNDFSSDISRIFQTNDHIYQGISGNTLRMVLSDGGIPVCGNKYSCNISSYG